MKILLVNTSDCDGGAARAAYRLLKGLQAIEVDAKMLVHTKKSGDYTIIGPRTGVGNILNNLRLPLDQIPARLYPGRKKTVFSSAVLPSRQIKKINASDADIVHLHWVAGGFTLIESLKSIKKPIVWTLHDMWPFTGGCHYNDDCKKYLHQCNACPSLSSKKAKDLSLRVFSRKQRTWSQCQMTIVTPSNWLGECARDSALLHEKRVEVIPNGLDINVYKPISKGFARDLLNLPREKHLVLFGAVLATSDKRKGFHLLFEALKRASKDFYYEVLIVGASKPQTSEYLGIPVHYQGYLHDDISLSLLYSAADVFIAPSVQDNLPNTVMESLACGTPVVAFDIGGMADMIEHKSNGYLAQPYESQDLAFGIRWILEDKERWRLLCASARKKVEINFEASCIARRHQILYEEILAAN